MNREDIQIGDLVRYRPFFAVYGLGIVVAEKSKSYEVYWFIRPMDRLYSLPPASAHRGHLVKLKAPDE